LEEANVGRAAGRAAHGIHQQPDPPNSQIVQQDMKHLHHFRLDARMIRAQNFGSDLMELAIAAFLRSLPAKHGSDVIELRETARTIQVVLQVRSNYGCGALGSEADVTAPSSGYRVHFLLHDVRLLSETTAEEIAFLQYRGSDLTEAVAPEE
jgi:hypothetical protein